jgi:cysteinyl-tRNA synthetase
MKKLNIQYPNVIIRVSEVIPQIIAYIQKIIDNGFAYPTKDGSIYFDTEKYKETGYEYITGSSEEIDKELFPPEVSEISESEENGIRNTKKALRDFALWKGRKMNLWPRN